MWVLRVAAIALAMWVAARGCCVADDAASLDAWQSSFQAVWAADSCAAEFQSWNKYWGAVHVFYFGEKGYAGWFADSEKLLTRVTSSADNATAAAQLALLGRRIGGEWAKPAGCRKVRTSSSWVQKMGEPGRPALLDWESQLNKAANADTGNGQSIEAAVKSINSQLDAIGIATPSS